MSSLRDIHPVIRNLVEVGDFGGIEMRAGAPYKWRRCLAANLPNWTPKALYIELRGNMTEAKHG